MSNIGQYIPSKQMGSYTALRGEDITIPIAGISTNVVGFYNHAAPNTSLGVGGKEIRLHGNYKIPASCYIKIFFANIENIDNQSIAKLIFSKNVFTLKGPVIYVPAGITELRIPVHVEYENCNVILVAVCDENGDTNTTNANAFNWSNLDLYHCEIAELNGTSIKHLGIKGTPGIVFFLNDEPFILAHDSFEVMSDENYTIDTLGLICDDSDSIIVDYSYD